MNYKNHIIRNFPHDYPLYKRMWANILFFFGRIIIHKRKNLLNTRDIKRAPVLLKKGDIVLLGNLHRLSSIFIGSPVTHSALYLGRREFLHSIVDGVTTSSLHDILTEYDTLVILRSKYALKKSMRQAISYARSHIGEPFDFEFEDDDKKLYCSELINKSFCDAEIPTGIARNKKRIHPKEFLNNHFVTVFMSHNLAIKDSKLILTEEN